MNLQPRPGYFFFSTFLAVFFASTLSAESPSDSDTLPELQVVTETWYPHNYLDENNQIVGRSSELVKRVMAHSGLSYSLNLYPWARAYKLATTQPNVLIYSIYRTPAREPNFHWICPLRDPIEISIYKLSSRPEVQLEQLSDVKMYKFLVNDLSHSHEYLLEQGLIEGEDFMTHPETSKFFELLLHSRIDLMVASEATMLEHTRQRGLPDNIVTPILKFHDRQVCMALSISSDKQIANKLQQSLSVIRSTSAVTE